MTLVKRILREKKLFKDKGQGLIRKQYNLMAKSLGHALYLKILLKVPVSMVYPHLPSVRHARPILKGDSLRGLQQYQKSIEIYNLTLEIDSFDKYLYWSKSKNFILPLQTMLQLLFFLALSLRLLKLYQESIVCLKIALNIDPQALLRSGKVQYFNNLRNTLFTILLLNIQARQYQESLKWFGKVLNLEKKNIMGVSLISFFLIFYARLLGCHDESIKYQDLVLGEDPRNIKALWSKDEYLRASNQFQKGIE